uniref:Uncharacterized protein n=1 Tax=Rhizophora mucronata TaxID=61149 RepID=A0A2P2L2H3_RHIMU
MKIDEFMEILEFFEEKQVIVVKLNKTNEFMDEKLTKQLIPSKMCNKFNIQVTVYFMAFFKEKLLY